MNEVFNQVGLQAYRAASVLEEPHFEALFVQPVTALQLQEVMVAFDIPLAECAVFLNGVPKLILFWRFKLLGKLNFVDLLRSKLSLRQRK